MAEKRANPRLLESCAIAIIQSKNLASAVAQQIKETVLQHGGQVLEPNRQGKYEFQKATHVVANTIDFDQYREAQDMMVPVVNQHWVHITVLRNKVAQVRPYSPDPRMIFSSVILTCADIPDMDKETIIGATMALGGTESKDLTRMTTHICALTMDHPKCKEAQAKAPKCKIVLPHWFDDCFKLGKRIDEGPYLFPDPEYLRKGPEDDIKVPSSQHLDGATSAVPNSTLSGSPRETLVVFSMRRVMLSSDLPINDRLRKILADLIKDGNGSMVDQVEDCDMLICQYRDGDNYQAAARTGKDVGNLAWLYHLIVHNEWTDPMRRLLHYPIPRKGIPGFDKFKITLSNYGGDARIYLENLITAAGATYTKTMRSDNTHLITARMHSEKCEAARDWNVEIVNHLWIEESYAECEPLALTNNKYQTFPLRTNLGEVIGQTFLNEEKLRAMFYPAACSGEGKAPVREGPANKRRKTDQSAKTLNTSSSAAKKRVSEAPRSAVKASKLGAAVNAGTFVTPAKGRHVQPGKENDTPSFASSISRSAKAQALSKLQDMAPDIALYEKEKKRSTKKDGHVVWGGKRAADQIDRERAGRSATPGEDGAEAEEEAEDEDRPNKRSRLAPIEIRICVTGFPRWQGNRPKEEADRKKLRSFGIQIVQETQPCNYLAAPTIKRTIKFLRQLARGAEIIHTDFLVECLEAGEMPEPDAYRLEDPDGEAQFGVSVETAVSRARANRGRLLWRVPVYCTADIINGHDSFRVVAEANGALFKVYRARSGVTIKPTTVEEDGGAPAEPVYLLSSASPAERQLWPKFEEMARKGHMEPRVVVSDWLLHVAMTQELTFDPRFLVRRWFDGEGGSGRQAQQSQDDD